MFKLLLSRRWLATSLLVLVGIGVTICLGIWQLSRYHQNKTLADHLAAMQVASTLLLDGGDPLAGLTSMEYRPVRAVGTFDFTHQVAIRNQIWLQSWGADMGYHLVAPLVFSDGSAVLVDRGWIPLKYNNPADWYEFDVSGPVSVTGIIRLPAVHGMGGQADPTLVIGQSWLAFWNIVNLDRLQTQLPYRILPIYVQQAPVSGDSNLPYKALSVPDLAPAGTNVGFSAMWFGFTGLLILGYPLYLRKSTAAISVRQEYDIS
jgi:surfeit locus 1 family protein